MTAPQPLHPPAGRYGREATPRARRRGVVALWLLGLVGLGAALWIGLGVAGSPVTWDDVGFSLEDDRVEVVFDVHRTDPSVTVRCRVEALSQQYAQVGVVTVDVAPSQERTRRLTVDVATAEPAVTGVVESCWVP